MKKYLILIAAFLLFPALTAFAVPCNTIALYLDSASYSANVGNTTPVTITTYSPAACAASVSTLESDFSGSYAIVPATGTVIDCQGATCSYSVGAASATTTKAFSVGCDAAGTYNLQAYNNLTNNTSTVSTLTCNSTTTAPSITSFAASPSSIASGQSSTLSWVIATSSNPATSASIDNGIGSVSTSSGSSVVSPTVTTVYTLSANNANGTTTASTTVTVTAPSSNPITTFLIKGASLILKGLSLIIRG